MMFTRAIVRPPARNFASGLTTAGLGEPDYHTAVIQHERYCSALESCGLRLVRLDPDPRYPDSTFVEDTAVVLPFTLLLTRPGAPSRQGEVDEMVTATLPLMQSQVRVASPGTLDGGDVCEAGDTWFVGFSKRTNEEGVRQLGALLSKDGRRLVAIDIRGVPGLLHLKSGLSWLGGRRLLVVKELAHHPELGDFERLAVADRESYAANCILVNDHLLLPSGYPLVAAMLAGLGYSIIQLEMSEFQKMDGGLSCLSLRF